MHISSVSSFASAFYFAFSFPRLSFSDLHRAALSCSCSFTVRLRFETSSCEHTHIYTARHHDLNATIASRLSKPADLCFVIHIVPLPFLRGTLTRPLPLAVLPAPSNFHRRTLHYSVHAHMRIRHMTSSTRLHYPTFCLIGTCGRLNYSCVE